jgi:hypothetical protein
MQTTRTRRLVNLNGIMVLLAATSGTIRAADGPEGSLALRCEFCFSQRLRCETAAGE